jgi:hypothetical protein
MGVAIRGRQIGRAPGEEEPTMRSVSPRNYGSFADFERDELRPMRKLGFCIDDLENEATFNPGQEDSGPRESDELDFG